MAPTTLDRPKTRKLLTATAAPSERLEDGEDGYPVKMWEVNGELAPFSLRPFTEAEKKVYWCPLGPDAKMWWKAQELNEAGHQVTIQREVWIAGKFSPRNAWEEHMTLDWLARTVEGGSAGATWVGYDHPKNKPGEPLHHWVCGTCGWACGVLACLEQHQLSRAQCTGIKSS